MKNSFLNRKVPALNLQEILIVLAIVGTLFLLALPNLTPLITKAKGLEAQTQLKAIFNAETTYNYMYSKFTADLNELDFIAPKTVKENGTANYRYEIICAAQSILTETGIVPVADMKHGIILKTDNKSLKNLLAGLQIVLDIPVI